MTLLTTYARALAGLSVALLLACPAAAETPSAASDASAAIARSATPRQNTSPKPPRICVALSGGGARGYAHIGVLKQLEMMRIPIDCIAGTSMGAVIGGVYASGLDAWQLEERIKALNLHDIALDRVDRRALPQTEREDDTQYPISGKLGFGNGSLRLPTGALQANRLVELLQNWTSRLPPGLHFDKLPIPFRAVATDLENGEQVVFDRGPLHLAMRASMAAPAVFAPIAIDGRLLTDGGLVQNLPVDVARSLNPDVIIAVNIATPLATREALGSFVEISQQMVGILTEQNVKKQKQKLRPGIDVLVEPDMKEMSFLDFGRAAEAITIGERTTRAMEAQLSHLALSVEAWRDHQARRNRPVLPEVRVDFVDVDASENIPAAFIRRRLELGTGESYDSEAINTRIDTLLASRQFESITHELVQRDGTYGVRVNARERAWGPHFFRFGLSLSSGFEGLSGFRLQLGHRRPWLTEAGLEWRNDIEVGNSQALFSELRQPIFSQEGAFVAGYAGYRNEPQNVYRGKDRIAEYGVTTARVGADLGIPLGQGGTLGVTRIGLQASRISARPVLGNPSAIDGNSDLPRAMYRQFGLRARVTIDQLDEPTFPRHGYLADFEALGSFSRDRTNYQSAQLQTMFAHSTGNHSVNLGVRLGSRWDLGANASADGSSLGGFTLGGFQQLSAYQPNQFNGNALAYANLTYLLRAVRFDLLDQSVFVGTSLEIGSAWDRHGGWTAADLRRSASLFLGFSSVIGPIHLGIALAPGGVRNFFFQLGRP